jgi:hypothetical protein
MLSIIVNLLIIILFVLETFLKRGNLWFSRRLCFLRRRVSSEGSLPKFGCTSQQMLVLVLQTTQHDVLKLTKLHFWKYLPERFPCQHISLSGLEWYKNPLHKYLLSSATRYPIYRYNLTFNFYILSLSRCLWTSSLKSLTLVSFVGVLTYLLTKLLTYLLTHSLTHSLTPSTEQSPSWEASRFLASQEIPRVLFNPMVHYRIHNCMPHPTSWRSILIHVLSSHLRLGLPSGLFPSGFHTKTIYTSLSSPSALHAPPISFFLI